MRQPIVFKPRPRPPAVPPAQPGIPSHYLQPGVSNRYPPPGAPTAYAPPAYAAPQAINQPNSLTCDRFLISRDWLSLCDRYRIYDERNNLLLVAEKPFFALPSRYIFWTPERQSFLLAQQDAILQWFELTYTLYDASNQPIASIRRDGFAGLARMTFGGLGGGALWRVTDASLHEVVKADLTSLWWSNYMLTAGNGAMLGQFTRRVTIEDKHTLDLGVDIMRTLDRRIAVALAVLIDSAEHGRRQI